MTPVANFVFQGPPGIPGKQGRKGVQGKIVGISTLFASYQTLFASLWAHSIIHYIDKAYLDFSKCQTSKEVMLHYLVSALLAIKTLH